MPHVVQKTVAVYRATEDTIDHRDPRRAFECRAVTLMTRGSDRKFRDYWNDTSYWHVVRSRLAGFLAFVDRRNQPEETD